jgi:hypothetical protein
MSRIFTFSTSAGAVGSATSDRSADAYLLVLGDHFDDKNRALRREAVYAGDWRQVALCDRAEGRDVGCGHPGSIDSAAIEYAESFTRDQARAIVAGVLLDSWLCESDGHDVMSVDVE